MSVTQILREIEALPGEDRRKVLEHVLRLVEPEIPESFREEMEDIRDGRVVDMDKALFEPYPHDKK